MKRFSIVKRNSPVYNILMPRTITSLKKTAQDDYAYDTKEVVSEADAVCRGDIPFDTGDFI